MRTKIGSILFIILASQATFAQVHIGPVAGVNYSWTAFDDKDLKDIYRVTPVLGFHVGGHLAFKVRKRFFLHSSLIYSTKGVVMEGKTDELNTEQDLDKLTAKYNYIELPIVYTAYFKGSVGKKEFKYSLGIGPNISYWLGGKGTIENDDTYEFISGEGGGKLEYDIVFEKDVSEITQNEMTVEKPNKVQLGLNVTAGFLFEPSPNTEMVLTFRYEIGHSFLSRDSEGIFKPTYFEQPLKIRNQGFRISLAYLIDLKVEERKKGKSTIKRK